MTPNPTSPSVDRRRFLRGAAATGALVAVPSWLVAACASSGTGGAPAPDASGMTTLRATHGTGLCNLGMFLLKDRRLTEADGVSVEFVTTPTNADIVTLFGAGQVDMSLLPYTQFMTLHDGGAPVTIVAGGGVEGCSLVAQPGIASAADLAGRSLGTFQADTLEMLPYDYLQQAGLSFGDVDVRYFGTSPELAQAFITGSIDSMCHIEPYATQALTQRSGSVLLSDGKDVYGPGYTDCVLAVRDPLLQENPAAVKAVIKGLMVAQQQSETDRRAAVEQTVGSYFKTTLDEALDASAKQPNVVDQRGKSQFMLDRAVGMEQLGYLRTLPGPDIFDWTLLDEVIAEQPALYDSLQVKTA